MSSITITGKGIGIDHVAAVARRRAKIRIAPQALETVRSAREILDHVAASGQQIYGLNTGLGANLRTPVAGDASRFQQQLLAGRSGAVGDPLPIEIVRAVMFARLTMLCAGGSGISPPVLTALARGVERRRASGHAIARFDRRRRSCADDGAGADADRRRRGRIPGPRSAGG